MSDLQRDLFRATLHAQDCDSCGERIGHGVDRTFIHLTTRPRRDAICLRCWAAICLSAATNLQDRMYWQIPLEWDDPEPIRRRPQDRT